MPTPRPTPIARWRWRTVDERSAAQRALDAVAKESAAAEARANGPEVERQTNACDANASACAAALPIIAADCDTGLKRNPAASLTRPPCAWPS